MKVIYHREFTDDELLKLAAKLKPSNRANSRLAKRAEVKGWLDGLVADALSVLSPARRRIDKSPGRLGDGTTCEEAALVDALKVGGGALTPAKPRKAPGWRCPGCRGWITTEPIARRCTTCKGELVRGDADIIRETE